MTNIYRQITLLYLRYKTLMVLTAFLALGAAGSSALLWFGYLRFPRCVIVEAREEAGMFLWIFGVWFVMLLGVFLKRQFATHRAHLLPRYRAAHVCAAFLVFALFLSAAAAWLLTLPAEVVATPWHVLWQLALLGVLFLVFAVYLGYLSVELILLLAFLGISVGSAISWDAFGLLRVGAGGPPAQLPVLASLIFVSAALFMARLMTLREEHFEYPYLLTWPPKELAKNQARVYGLLLRVEQAIDLLLRGEVFLEKVFGKRTCGPRYPAYPRHRGVVARSRHWDCFESRSLRHLQVLVLVATPLYLWYLKANPQVHIFFTGVHENFFLLVAAPILTALCFNYKKMGYWQRDMMKPVRRRDIVRERGTALLIALFSFWALFALYFAVLPSIVIDPALLRSAMFWAHLALTGSYAFAAFSWILFLSCLSVTNVIVLNFIALAGLSLAQTYGAGAFPLNVLIATSVLSLAAGAVFCKTALMRWYEKEIT